MGEMGSFEAKGMKELQKSLEELQADYKQQLLDACAKELAARLLAKVIKRTPKGQYPASSGKKGGTLQRGWTSKTQEEAQSGKKVSAKAYADSLAIRHTGNTLTIEIINPVEYASYVEYGHRKVNNKGWVSGRFMMTIAEQEIQNIAPKVLESKIKKFLSSCLP